MGLHSLTACSGPADLLTLRMSCTGCSFLSFGSIVLSATHAYIRIPTTACSLHCCQTSTQGWSLELYYMPTGIHNAIIGPRARGPCRVQTCIVCRFSGSGPARSRGLVAGGQLCGGWQKPGTGVVSSVTFPALAEEFPCRCCAAPNPTGLKGPCWSPYSAGFTNDERGIFNVYRSIAILAAGGFQIALLRKTGT